MSKNGGRGRRQKGKGAEPVGEPLAKIVAFLATHSRMLSIITLAAIIIVGVYIRLEPALKYKLELDANDPWIMYWLAEYFRQNGLFSFDGLRDVKEFWWPIGRDFLKTEHIGVSWIAAATYPIAELAGLTLKEWIALFPVFAGAITIPLAYMLVVEITGSRLGGLSAAALFGLLPGAIVRTTVGFVEKTGIAVPFFLAFILLLAKALKHEGTSRGLVYAILSGFMGGLIVFIWGGYDLAVVTLAFIVLVEPLVAKPSLERLKIYAASATVMLALIILSPIESILYPIAGLGVSLVFSLLVYALWARSLSAPLPLLGEYKPVKHAWVIATSIVSAIVVFTSGIVDAPGRLLMALGIRNLSPLAESVQEHQPVGWGYIVSSYGVPLALTLVGAAIVAYRIVARRSMSRLETLATAVYAIALILVFANKQMAYFTQMAAFFTSIAAGITIGLVLEGLMRFDRSGKLDIDPIKLIGGILLVMIVVLGSTVYGYASYASNAQRAPSILTGGVGVLGTNKGSVVPLNDAWTRMLDYIEENTSEDSLIITWWDYGYWVTVNTGRKTMADGATINETQIREIALLLTGKEGTANYILKRIGAEPGKTYILFYELYSGRYNKDQNLTVVFPQPRISPPGDAGIGVVSHGMADFAKSFQMLKIAHRIDPFATTVFGTSYTTEVVDDVGNRWFHFPGFVGVPEENRTLVLDTLLYQLGMYGLTYLNKQDVAIVDDQCKFIENSLVVLPAAIKYQDQFGNLVPEATLPAEPDTFRPVAITVGCPLVSTDDNGAYFTAVIVQLWEWTG